MNEIQVWTDKGHREHRLKILRNGNKAVSAESSKEKRLLYHGYIGEGGAEDKEETKWQRARQDLHGYSRAEKENESQ